MMADSGDDERRVQATLDRDVFDPRRRRDIGVRVSYPLGTVGLHSLVFISHGGLGADNGETLFEHLARELASSGMVAIQLGHRRSESTATHRLDRPLDVSFVLTALSTGDFELPDDFGGVVDTARVGHVGHSAGAYTSHALAGAEYPFQPSHDPRIVAIAPISPQGVGDEFEAFDRGPGENTWATVRAPVFVLLGSEELDTNGLGTFIEVGWRLRPFDRYPDASDRLQVIVRGQDHLGMGSRGAAEVKTFIARNVRAFFDLYLRGRGEPCAVGTLALPPTGIERLERRPAKEASRIAACR